VRILVIEDNSDIAANLGDYLEDRGHTVDFAADGVTGLHLAVVHEFDAIVLDLNLPGMDGFAVLAALKSEPQLAGVPILAVTALAMAGDREKVLAAGFDGYISKPIEPESFVAELEAFLAAAPAAASVPAPAAQPAPKPITTSERTLLLVDDDRFMLGVLNDMLTNEPYRVLSAQSGEEALALLAAEPVDVILCDQAIPGMRGTEVLAEAARRYPKTVRLMLSGQPDLSEIEAAIAAGVADGHYIKPVGAALLRERLGAAFRLHSERAAA